jgi:outer membrane lipoprotein-sorting protein
VIYCFLTAFSFADEVDTYINSIEVKYRDVQSLSATFTQETSNVMLQTPYLQQGTFALSKPHFLHWEVTSPLEQHYYADKDKITVWTPSQNQAIISSNQETSHDVSSLLTNLNELKTRYNIVLLDKENDQIHLKLSSDKLDGEIELWFTQKDYVLNQVMVNTSNAKTKVILSEVTLNPTFEQDEFTFVPAEGADVIDSRQ